MSNDKYPAEEFKTWEPKGEYPKIVTKPWGKEIWLELNGNYCYKRIHINAGHKTSYQLHEQKLETNYIIAGEAEVWLEDDAGVVNRYRMSKDTSFTVKPGRRHRVIALTDVILQEVSTPQVDDIIRLQDDANRPDGRIDSEHQTKGNASSQQGLENRV